MIGLTQQGGADRQTSAVNGRHTRTELARATSIDPRVEMYGAGWIVTNLLDNPSYECRSG